MQEFKSQLISLTPVLRAYAMTFTRNSADADDLVQETLLRAWRSRATFAAGTNFKAWLFRIVRNTYFSSWGSKRRYVELDDARLDQLSSPPEQEWRLAYASLLSALQLLAPSAREALLLVVGAGLSYEQAAQVCGVPLGTLKSRVNRAREHLSRLMESEEAAASGADGPRRTALSLEQSKAMLLALG